MSPPLLEIEGRHRWGGTRYRLYRGAAATAVNGEHWCPFYRSSIDARRVDDALKATDGTSYRPRYDRFADAAISGCVKSSTSNLGAPLRRLIRLPNGTS